MNECEAELVYYGELICTVVLPGVTLGGIPCGKPAIEKQDSVGSTFDAKFPPRRLCAEHWDAWIVMLKEAREDA